ncbi:MAG: MoaD/ThiS family protein [Chloroflexota bacterium]
MKVTVKTFASLRPYLPGGAKTVEVPSGTTVGDLLPILDLPAPQVHIMIRNNRQAEADEVLREGDTVAFFPPVAGG